MEAKLPDKLAERAGWAADIHAAMEALHVELSEGNICAVVAVTEQESGFQVDPAVPNPFVAGTSLRFDLAVPSIVSVRLFDVGGRELRSLAEDVSMAAGPQALRWDGRDERGRAMPAGVYFYRIETAGQSGGGRLVRLLR